MLPHLAVPAVSNNARATQPACRSQSVPVRNTRGRRWSGTSLASSVLLGSTLPACLKSGNSPFCYGGDSYSGLDPTLGSEPHRRDVSWTLLGICRSRGEGTWWWIGPRLIFRLGTVLQKEEGGYKAGARGEVAPCLSQAGLSRFRICYNLSPCPLVGGTHESYGDTFLSLSSILVQSTNCPTWS